jgi:hypothetical protein
MNCVRAPGIAVSNKSIRRRGEIGPGFDEIGDLNDRTLLVLADRDDDLGALQAGEVSPASAVFRSLLSVPARPKKLALRSCAGRESVEIVQA